MRPEVLVKICVGACFAFVKNSQICVGFVNKNPNQHPLLGITPSGFHGTDFFYKTDPQGNFFAASFVSTFARNRICAAAAAIFPPK
jgi:hypothetical protein